MPTFEGRKKEKNSVRNMFSLKKTVDSGLFYINELLKLNQCELERFKCDLI